MSAKKNKSIPLVIAAVSGIAIDAKEVIFDATTPFDPEKPPKSFCLSNVCLSGGFWKGTVVSKEELIRLLTKPEVVFYIHGFNNQPADVFGTYETLNASFAPKNIQLIPVLWACSDACLPVSPVGDSRYSEDQEYSRQAGTALGGVFARFAKLLAAAPPAGRRQISVVAHSMGNRLLYAAMFALSQRIDPCAFRFRAIFSIAADVPCDIFEEQKGGRLWTRFAQQVYVYFAHFDFLLGGSRLINGSQVDRLGYAGPSVRLDNLTALDCSRINHQEDLLGGHSYQTSKQLLDHLLSILINTQQQQSQQQSQQQQQQPSQQQPLLPAVPDRYMSFFKLSEVLPAASAPTSSLQYVNLLSPEQKALVGQVFPGRNYKYYVPKDTIFQFMMSRNGKVGVYSVLIKKDFLTDGNSGSDGDWDDHFCQKDWLIHDWIYYQKQCAKGSDPVVGAKVGFGRSPSEREAADTLFKYSDESVAGSLIYRALQVGQIFGRPQAAWLDWCNSYDEVEGKDLVTPPFLNHVLASPSSSFTVPPPAANISTTASSSRR